MFSCEYCKILKNSFFYRSPPVAASRLNLELLEDLHKDRFVTDSGNQMTQIENFVKDFGI